MKKKLFKIVPTIVVVILVLALIQEILMPKYMTDIIEGAMIEEYCDYCEEEMKKKTGGFYTTRFSAGYGDYPISLQGEFIRVLSADKLIGLTATENHILVPRKSVTAVIGITDKEQAEIKNKCDGCNMKNMCRFRKEGLNCGH